MSTCLHCDISYFKIISLYFQDNEAALDFLRKHRVLPTTVKCGSCNKNCTLDKDLNVWCCQRSFSLNETKKTRQCAFAVSDLQGTFLYNADILAWKVLLFINHFLSPDWDHRTVTENLDISYEASDTWHRYCSEITDHWLSNQPPIGGPDIEVEIDESNLVKDRTKGGQISSYLYLVGGIERVSKRKFVVPLPKGSIKESNEKDRLLPIIQKHILPQSIIYSGSWAAYRPLQSLGYTQHTTGSSEGKKNKKIHTDNIEKLWRELQACRRRSGVGGKGLRQFLAKHLFVKSEKSHGRVLHQFLLLVSRLYPHLGTKLKPDRPFTEGGSSESEEEAELKCGSFSGEDSDDDL